MTPIHSTERTRLGRAFEVGALVAQRRKQLHISQNDFSSKLGISRKTLSDFERGVADHISLSTALRAMALAGLVVEVAPHRKPTISEVLETRARQLTQADERAVGKREI